HGGITPTGLTGMAPIDQDFAAPSVHDIVVDVPAAVLMLPAPRTFVTSEPVEMGPHWEVCCDPAGSESERASPVTATVSTTTAPMLVERDRKGLFVFACA